MGDLLKKLPPSDQPLDERQFALLKNALGNSEHVQTANGLLQVCNTNLDVLSASVLFFILSLPFVDPIMDRVYPTSNVYVRNLVKAIVFAVLLFITNNYYLCKAE
jgi:hypothetical protein